MSAYTYHSRNESWDKLDSPGEVILRYRDKLRVVASVVADYEVPDSRDVTFTIEEKVADSLGEESWVEVDSTPSKEIELVLFGLASKHLSLKELKESSEPL